MDFFVDTNCGLPAHLQIQEQIKLALLVGQLRPGDTLPSIRDVEHQIPIARTVVRKAYVALQRTGILTAQRGKGVLVKKNLKYSQCGNLPKACESFSRHVLIEVEKMGISPSAFARYLYTQAREQERMTPHLFFADASKSLAIERAAQISCSWQVNILGVSLDELGALSPTGQKNNRKILTPSLWFGKVRELVRGSAIEVISLNVSFAQPTLNEVGNLPANASVGLVLDDWDCSSSELIVDTYRKMLGNPLVKLRVIPLSRVRDLERFVGSAKYHKIIFSDRTWEKVPPKLRRHRRLARPQMKIDFPSLERVRVRAGVII